MSGLCLRFLESVRKYATGWKKSLVPMSRQRFITHFCSLPSVSQRVSARCLSVRPTCDVDILDTNHALLERIRHNQSPATTSTQNSSRRSECLTQSLAGDGLFRRSQLKSYTPTSSSSDRSGQATTFFPDIYAELPVQAGNNRK